MKLNDSEKRDLINLINSGKYLPDYYRYLLFENPDQVELTWNGKSSEVTSLVLPFQIIEQVDEPRNEDTIYKQSSLIDFESGRQLKGWNNKLIWGDNKYIISSLKNGPMRDEIEKEGGLKLIYIDPPFDVGADFSMNLQIGENSYEKRPNILEQIAYRDTWGMGADSFLSMIYERLILMRDLLSEDGSIFIHCDDRLESSLKLIMDEIFGNQNYKNSITWKRTTSHNDANKFGRITDRILFYTKSEKFTFNKTYIPLSKEEVNKKYPLIEKNTGRRYASMNLSAAGPGEARDFGGRIINPPIGAHWRWSQDRINDALETGKIFFSKNGVPRYKQYADEHEEGSITQDLWTDCSALGSQTNERLNYPTQKPLTLAKRIIETASNENDLVADFFSGSGTFAEAAENLNRKWICTDLGKFAIHTTRKRMIGIQRNHKKMDKNWRAFEILNLGKYQREHYIYNYNNERDQLKYQQQKQKERDFEELIINAYHATSIDGFNAIHGKKGNSFVSIGPINQPLSRNHVEEVILECTRNNIVSVDILGFEYEMGLFPTIQEEARNKGLRLVYKQIPMEIFDKRAIAQNEVIFHDIAYIDFQVIKNGEYLSVELKDFAVFYNEENFNMKDKLKKSKSKVVVENGNIIEKKIDKEGILSEVYLTKTWSDWIDYWSVDFNYESKKEIIKIEKDNQIQDVWTGNFVFENEWQSFRTLKNEQRLELVSTEKRIDLKKTVVAVKVVDIFGNDTMEIIEVNM